MMETKQQVIAMGGGGFSMEPENLLLDRYIIQRARKPRPSVCIGNGYAADDGAAAHFVNGQLFSAISSRPHAKVYQVGMMDKREQSCGIRSDLTR